jgi:hypothetical protein
MRSERARAVAALTILLVIAASHPGIAQVNVQLSGIVESVEGTTLVLRTAAPPRRVTLGTTPTPDRSTLQVDLDQVPASQWVFLRPGERIAVVGLPSADGSRFTAIAVVGGAGPRRESETP